MVSRWSLATSILAATALSCNAFAPSSQPALAKFHVNPVVSTSSVHMGPPIDPELPVTEQYGEGSRKYRRTVYTHNEWVKHRSSDRFIRNLTTLFNSGVYKQVGNEVLATVSVATFVCLWNGLAGGFQDLEGVKHDAILPFLQVIGLPLAPFTILSSSLGLLLVFRTNTSYGRWDEARKFWGLNINHTRDLNRMATAWYGNQNNLDSTVVAGAATPAVMPIDPAQREYDLRQVSLFTWAFVRSMKRHLSPVEEDEEAFRQEIRSRLSASQAEYIISAAHRPNRALYDLSVAIEKLPMHFLRKCEINKNLSIFEDTLGGCERLLSSPVPLFYSRHTARFLASWLLLLPFALYEPFGSSWNHVTMIPATAFVSVFMFGIDELSTQLEEPFTILPMQGFCDKIGMWCDEIVSWAGQGQEGYPYEIADDESFAPAMTMKPQMAQEPQPEPETEDEGITASKRRSFRSIVKGL